MKIPHQKHLTSQFICSGILKQNLLIALIFFGLTLILHSQQVDISKKLEGFDQYMDKVLKDWNIAGAGVAVIYKDKLVFSRGYGYRDYGNKVPVTPNTLFQIASNTKLFTAISVGLFVDQGKLDWDKPVKNYIPSIEFFNDDLDKSVTIRDMLSHRTGISRHDFIWYKADFKRKDLWDRLKYLEPSLPLRQGFLYNNMMYVASGYIIELLSSNTWEDFVRSNILTPLDMKNTVFTVKEMVANPDHGVPYNEKRDTNILYRIPYYEDTQAVGPAGSIISNIEDMSHWLITLMNNGKYHNKQIIPEKVIKATIEPSMALPNTELENKGYKEILNVAYGMGRFTASYRGHFMVSHGGDLPGFHSQISTMPYDSIGAIVFVIGDQGAPLYDIITYNIYERMLGLSITPWSDRGVKDMKEAKLVGKQGRSKVGSDRISGTKPSHKPEEYAGKYENPAYGIMTVSVNDTSMLFDFHNIKLPLHHYHYDRFDTPNDEEYGLFSLNFITNPQGDIDAINISLDEKQITFTKKTDESLTNPSYLSKFMGKYEMAGSFINIELIDKGLFLIAPGVPQFQLIPVKTNVFRLKEFADYRFEFVVLDGKITGLKQIDPSGEYFIKKVN